ncbi:uncharacterized protein LOC123290950 [Chrysoperla carnea]|uniref:uncharacterized protein LOC123290950 n=1 Tax=Chrysoperla carnea TaxID=189513 RepID=UPI001D094105|nr:uncharacterized protein LOC123290950 [Chrysoperla carnea]
MMSSETEDGGSLTGSYNENLLLVYKELKFEHKRHREDVLKKCAEFWRYIYSRPDIQPVNAIKPSTVMNLNNVACESKIKCKGDCNCSLKCDRRRQRWLATLLAIHKINCSKLSTSTTKPCKLCEQNQKIFDGLFTSASPKNIQSQLEQIRELSKWQEDTKSITNNLYYSRKSINREMDSNVIRKCLEDECFKDIMN